MHFVAKESNEPLTSTTKERNVEGVLSTNLSSFCWEASTEYVFCVPVPMKCPVSITSSLVDTDMETKQKREGRVSDDHQKKFENFRQTLIRFFKRNMRKLRRTVLKTNTKKKPYIAAKKIRNAIKRIYNLHEIPSDAMCDHLCDLLHNLQNLEYFECKIANVGQNFKSCNNSYVSWLFNAQVIKDLYSIHHTLAKDSYRKILKITNTLDSDEERKLLDFIENIPYENKN